MPRKDSLQFHTFILAISLFFFLAIETSCKKYLDQKPRQNLAVPNSLADLQAILDNELANGYSPGDLEFVADNYYLSDTSWFNAPVSYRNGYIWDKNATTTIPAVWNNPYNTVYQANFVLDLLPSISFNASEHDNYNNVKGEALFFRSFMFYQLAQLFCRPFSNSAASDPGIVLRLTSAIGPKSNRSTVQETYEQIINDLRTSASLLAIRSVFPTRPNKAAAYGMLARVYLSMRDYLNAGSYADSALNLSGNLVDYKTLSNQSTPPIASNPEILFLSYEGFAPRDLFIDSHQEIIDSLLYQSYDPNDLRKTVFFAPNTKPGTYFWKGSYYNFASFSAIFDGIATDEIYLIRAESRVKTNPNWGPGMDDLNTLLRHRWKANTFSDLSASDSTDALNKIRSERRKELIYRGLRWTDLRRFNLEGANIMLKRVIGVNSYSLPANDFRWVLLIPDDEIARSGIAQNPR